MTLLTIYNKHLQSDSTAEVSVMFYPPTKGLVCFMRFIILLLSFVVFNLSHADKGLASYDIVMVERTGGDWRAIKYNIESGESWYIRNGVFIYLTDDRVLPKSKYKVLATKHKGGWGAVKLDMNSGDTWKLKGEMWIKVKDTTDK